MRLDAENDKKNRRGVQPAIPSDTRCAAADHMNAAIHVYDEAGNVIETHEHAGEFKEW